MSSLKVFYHKLDYYNDVHISLEILNVFQPNLAEIWLMHYSVIKTLKYWWPLTYIQGHVIQDGCQIQSEKSILGQKITITRPIFWQIW